MSPQAKANYDENERQHTSITRTMIKTVALFAVIMKYLLYGTSDKCLSSILYRLDY